MRKFYFSVATAMIILCMVSCYRDDLVLQNDPNANDDPLTKSNDFWARDNNVKMVMHKITPERAMQIANEAPALFEPNRSKARTTPKHALQIIPIVDNVRSLTRSAGGRTDTLMHIVNYSDNQGYAVISFDDRDGDIIAYSGNGNFNIQDTVSNQGLKLHLEMMIAYQQSKRDRIQKFEAQGEEYLGELVLCEPNDEPQPQMERAGSPGMPGLPGNCVNPNYKDRYWSGKSKAIENAQRKYPSGNFGTPIPPPVITFATGKPGFLGPDTPCPTPPYCEPPLWNYDDYYSYYGAEYATSLTVCTTPEQQEPLLKTYWHQRTPLNYGAGICILPLHFNCGTTPAGCAPISMGQIMTFHHHPSAYTYSGVRTFIDLALLETKKSNQDIIDAGLGTAAGKFIKEIANRLDVTYTCKGTGAISLATGTTKVQDAFESFGYSIGYDGAWNYKNDGNFNRVKQSIMDKQPVFIYGFPRGWTGILNYFNGHTWVLDGYKKIRNKRYYQDFTFDEYGNYAYKKGGTYTQEQEYVHANMGWSDEKEDVWVRRGVYDNWSGHDYSGKLYYIAGIKRKYR